MKKTFKKFSMIIFIIVLITNLIIPTYAVESENESSSENDSINNNESESESEEETETNPNKKSESSLEINFVTNNDTIPMNNADILIYKLASFENKDFSITWEDTYSDYMIDLGLATDEEIISEASELANFVNTNNINADYKIKTDSNGKATVTLENGIYLIYGEKTVKNDITYTPNPCIIQLPYTDEDGTLIYDASIELKYEMKLPDPTPTIEPGKTGSTKKSFIPKTGDIILIVVGILILVLALNILQMIHEVRKSKNKNK